MDRRSDQAKNVLRRVWSNIDELSTNKYKTLLNAPRNKNAQELEFANFNASLDKLRKRCIGFIKARTRTTRTRAKKEKQKETN